MRYVFVMIAESTNISGPRLSVRPLSLKDASGPYARWINDPRLKRYLAARFSYLGRADLERYIQTCNDSSNDMMLAVCRNEEHVGNLKLQGIDQTHKSASVSIVLDPECWGMGAEAIALSVSYAFNVLGLERVDAGCFAVNERAIGAFLKCGFINEGLSRRMYLMDGERWDVVRMGLLSTDPPKWMAELTRV